MSLREFEGNINGKKYTDDDEFKNDLLALDYTDGDVYVSYKYVNNNIDENKCVESKDCKCSKFSDNYVSEIQYVKNIVNKKDVELDEGLVEKLKNASNKLDIRTNVINKIVCFDENISDNLLHINELKGDYKKLEEKIKLINSQIKTLDDANNNYYLNKEYYTNIKMLIDEHLESNKLKEKCDCGCKSGECKCSDCKCDKDKEEEISFNDICDNASLDIAKYLNKMNINNITDLVDYFLKD